MVSCCVVLLCFKFVFVLFACFFFCFCFFCLALCFLLRNFHSQVEDEQAHNAHLRRHLNPEYTRLLEIGFRTVKETQISYDLDVLWIKRSS